MMRIYHPVRGVGGALRENSFAIIDDAGVEIGQGGLEFRVLTKMLPDRPLDIEMNMNAHPVASDTLFGALSARAESIKDELKIMCVLFTEDIGGVLELVFNEEGTLEFRTSCDEGDLLYDDIGCGLKIRELQRTKEDLLQALELYLKVMTGKIDEEDEE